MTEALKKFTWRREPVLYVALAIACLQVVAPVVAGDVSWVTVLQPLATLLIGFFLRGQVTPAK